MSDRGVTELRQAGRRAPAVLLLFALVALIAGVCHGAHGHALAAPGAVTSGAVPAGEATAVGAVASGAVAPRAVASGGTAAFSVPGFPHGCERSGEGWSFDAHLPAQSAGAQFPAPDAGGAVLAYDEVFPEAPHTRCVRGRAGPGPEPGRLLIALGVDRN
ncbi:hypothetical protein [Streptomyces sp. NPDC046371]|uniref:hypothetical protein n=1 Tax=unclassified Streptomyces TaxID=2593676 RepID=UPI0033FCAF07